MHYFKVYQSTLRLSISIKLMIEHIAEKIQRPNRKEGGNIIRRNYINIVIQKDVERHQWLRETNRKRMKETISYYRKEEKHFDSQQT